MILAIALAAILRSAPDPVVTVLSRGESVSALLKDLSAQTRLTLDVTPAVANEIVLVNVNMAPFSQLKERLATAVGAEWHQDGAVLRLARGSVLAHEQLKEEQKDRIAQIKKALDKFPEKAMQLKPFDEAAAEALVTKVEALYQKVHGEEWRTSGTNEAQFLESDTPTGRLATTIFASLDPATLAALDPGDRIVLSTQPTAMQLPLRMKGRDAIIAFERDQATLARALEKRKHRVFEGTGGMDAGDSTEATSRILMVIERPEIGNYLNVELILADAQGKILHRTKPSVGLDTEAGSSTVSSDEGMAQFSTGSSQMLEDMRRFMYGQLKLDKNDALMSQISDPVHHDPLSFVVADGVFALAESKKESLVAVIPDSVYVRTIVDPFQDTHQFRLHAFRKTLNEGCLVKEESGWFVARPRHFVQCRTNRTDRQALAKFLQLVLRQEWASLDDIAEFISRIPRRILDSSASLIACMAYPLFAKTVESGDIAFFRLYGNLPPEGRHALLTGSLRAGNLSPECRSELTRMFYRSGAHVSMSRESDSVDRPRDLTDEVTMALPNGVPPDATLVMRLTQATDAVIGDEPKDSESCPGVMSAHDLGSYLTQNAQATARGASPTYKFNGYRLGTRTIYQFQAEWAHVSISDWVYDLQFPLSAPSVPIEQLPASFREAVRKEMEKLSSESTPSTAPTQP